MTSNARYSSASSLPDTWHDIVSARTVWPGVRPLWPDESGFSFNVRLSGAPRKFFRADRVLIYFACSFDV